MLIMPELHILKPNIWPPPPHPGCTGKDVLSFSEEIVDVTGGWGTEQGPKWVTDTVNKCCGSVFEVGLRRMRTRRPLKEQSTKSWISRRKEAAVRWHTKYIENWISYKHVSHAHTRQFVLISHSVLALEWCHVSFRLRISFWRLSNPPSPLALLIVSIPTPPSCSKLIHSLKQSSSGCFLPPFLFHTERNAWLWPFF